MWSMWNAPSDLDYYGESGFGEDEPEVEEEPELEEQDMSEENNNARMAGRCRVKAERDGVGQRVEPGEGVFDVVR